MRYNTKIRLLIVLSILLLVVIAVAIMLGISKSQDTLNTEPSETIIGQTMQQTETSSATEVDVTEISTQSATDAPTQAPTEKPTEPPTEVPTEAPTEPPTEAPTEKPQTSSGNQGGNTGTVKPTTPKETEPPALSFPYAIPGTSLVIDQVNSYDGIFLEDGSDKEVSGISVIVLKNKGSSGVEYANITLVQNGKELQYKATAIPAGATAVVQEDSAAAYSSAKFTSCSADVALLDSFEMSASLVKVEEAEDGYLTVTNLGDSTIPCVRVFYKFAMEKGEIYVGGITYNAKITQLEPGTPQQIAPSHYAAGSSEIMMVRTYDTTE